jgi:hypothetical protein
MRFPKRGIGARLDAHAVVAKAACASAADGGRPLA